MMGTPEARASSGRPMTPDDVLLEQFVLAFGAFDDMVASKELDPHAWALRRGSPGRFGAAWRPRRVQLAPTALARVHARLPARYPALFERFLSTYRWAEVELHACRLLASPRGRGLSGFVAAVFQDKALVETLLPAGYLQFGKGPGGTYDPVCFDTSRSTGADGSPVIQLDHEEILCWGRLKVVKELAPSFRHLVGEVIESARALGVAPRRAPPRR